MRLLEMKNIKKAFGDIYALNGINLNLDIPVIIEDA